MTLRGLLFALGVLALFGLIFVPLARRVVGGRDEGLDAERMRRVYVALSLYEMEHDGHPAPNLGLVRRDVEASDLQSVGDPESTAVVKKPDYPLDPAIPGFALRSPTRVSWSYRWHWPEAARAAVGNVDPRRGLLASWWTGPVMRVDVNGALVRASRKNTDALTFEDLFDK